MKRVGQRTRGWLPPLLLVLTALLATATASSADTTPPTGSILINDGATTTTSPEVTLNLSATDTGGSGLASMHFRNSTLEPYSAWEPYQATKAWTLKSGTGTRRVYVQYMDGAGNISDANAVTAGAQGYSDEIVVYDMTPPTGSILINNGAASTASPEVTLNLSATDTGGSGLASMHFRNSTLDPYSAWEPYQDTKAWTLKSGTGTRRVYVQYMDGAGNVSDANAVTTGAQGYSDEIVVYDTTRPTGSILINNGAASTTTPEVTLNLSASDAGGSGLASMRFRESDAGPYGEWEPYQITKSWTLTSGLGTLVIYVQFMDGSGNTSDADPVAAGAQGYQNTIKYNGASNCTDCHGNPPHPGCDSLAGTADDAPNVMGNGVLPFGGGAVPKPFDDGTWGYNVNGHGANGTAIASIAPNLACAECHDIDSPAPTTHFNCDPAENVDQRLNTRWYFGKLADTRNANTSHLVSGFFSGAYNPQAKQVTFDDYCYSTCHLPAGMIDSQNMRHSYVNGNIDQVLGVMEFNVANSTTDDPKQDRGADNAWAPWTIDDLTNDVDANPPTTRHYGVCVSCHNPHGTSTLQKTRGTNKMVVRNWKDTAMPAFCSSNCHRVP